MERAADVLLPIDVAVVDPDLLWRVEYMNAIRHVMVKEFTALQDAVDALTPGHPSVVVIGPTVDASRRDLAPAVRETRPEVVFLAVAADGEDAAALDNGALDGVARVLPTEVTAADLAEAVHQLLPRRAAPAAVPAAPVTGRSAPVNTATRAAPVMHLPENMILVTAAKGGEGTTTVAANLAAALAARPNLRVALVDADGRFGDVAVHLGLTPVPSVRASQLPLSEEFLDRLFEHHEATGMLVARSPRATTPDTRPGAVVLDLLAEVASRADVAVVDAPLPLVLATDLHRAASVVVLVTSERAAELKNAIVATRELAAAPRLVVLVNETRPTDRLRDLKELSSSLGVPVIGRVPYDGAIDRSTQRTPPRIIAGSHSKLARAVTAAAEDIVRRAPFMM